jgi:hypothetical protein
VRESDHNPAANVLGAGVSEEGLREALKRSGHPLQAAVSEVVSERLKELSKQVGGTEWSYLQEEWTYDDADTGQTRSVDGLAEAGLWTLDPDGGQPRIRPTLNLIIECKQSELPYVFFTRSRDVAVPSFPRTAGFPHEQISLSTDDDLSTYQHTVLAAIGLRNHRFTRACPLAVSFSTARRRGPRLEISGEDTFRGLTLPLLKAQDRLIEVSRLSRKYYTDGRLILPVAVLRAPMITVEGPPDSVAMEATPWVRVLRYEPVDSDAYAPKIAAFDVVHEDFLPEYLELVADLAKDFASSVIRSLPVLLEGTGFSPGLAARHWPDEVKPFSRPRRLRQIIRVRRGKSSEKATREV